MGSNFGFPALAIQPPPDPLKQMGEVMNIRNQMQQGQMNDVALQQARQAQQSQQTLMRLFAQNNGDMNQTVADAKASGQVLPEHILDFQTKATAAQVQMANLSDKQLEVLGKKHDIAFNELESLRSIPAEQRTPQTIFQHFQRLSQAGLDDGTLKPILQSVLKDPSDDNLKSVEMGLNAEKWLKVNEEQQRIASMPTVAQAQQKNAAELDKAMTESLAAHQTLLSMPTPEEAKTARAAALLKTQADTASAQAATAKSRAETALMGAKPVFAFDPATNQRVLTSMPQAQAKGYTNPIQVTEGDVNKETESVRQFNDAQMNVSRYKVALQNLPPVSDDHAAIMTRILSDQKVFGGMGENVLASIGEGRTNDAITQMRKAKNWNTLTPEEQDAVVGYIRAKSAVPAFQKALTQVGRTNKEVMELEMQNIPMPIEGPSAFKKLDSFQENIDTASKGLTRVPWLGTPQDVRQTIEGGAANQSTQNLAAQQHFADYRSQNGPGQYKGIPSQDTGLKRYRVGMPVEGPGMVGKVVTKVYPDGSFDAQ